MEPESDNVDIGYRWSGWEFNFNVETNFQMIKYLLKEYRAWRDLRRMFRILREQRKREEAERASEWIKYWKRQP